MNREERKWEGDTVKGGYEYHAVDGRRNLVAEVEIIFHGWNWEWERAGVLKLCTKTMNWRSFEKKYKRNEDMKMADSQWIYDISAHGGFKRRRSVYCFYKYQFIL